jgi:predicted transposase YdaD
VALKFDATLKTLLEESPADWPALAGHPAKVVDVIDADVSTVSAATDKVLRLRGKPGSIMHFDFQAGPDTTLPRRTHGYNALLEDRHDLMVRSVVVLLRPEANLSTITGTYERCFPGEVTPYLTFHYQVIRVWQLPVGPLLTGGLGTLPLAPISAVSVAEVPGVIARMNERLRDERAPGQKERLWTATYVLMGLRYQQAFTDRLFQEVLGMEESVTYQAIVAKGVALGRTEGALDEARKILLRLGQHRFGGAAPARARRALEAITDLARLEELTDRVLQVSTWEALLELPPPRSRRPKRNG